MGESNLASYREILQKKVYPNGLTLLFQPVNYVASVSCGLYLRRGSSSETENELGYFHFIEHMLFKGTENRSSKEIVESVERVGGQINAVTSREYTAYYVSLIRDELPLALDILSDMVFRPLLKQSDIDLERKVIVEEIKSYEDSPEDFLYDEYYHSFFGGAPIGRNIAGTQESVLAADEKDLRQFYDKHYRPENMILSISGNASIEEVEAWVDRLFPIGSMDSVASPPEDSNPSYPSENAIPESSVIEKHFIKKFHKRKIEQVNFYLGAEGFSRPDPKTPALILASNVLGGGMSSRLFQEIREKKGYCYGIQSFPSGYRFNGLMTVFCATSPKTIGKAISLILKEIETLLKTGFSQEELEYSITNIVGGLAMGYETTESRMNNIAAQELYYGKFYSLLERIQLIASVDLDLMNQVFRESFDLENYHLSLIGDLKASEAKAIPHSLRN